MANTVKLQQEKIGESDAARNDDNPGSICAMDMKLCYVGHGLDVCFLTTK